MSQNTSVCEVCGTVQSQAVSEQPEKAKDMENPYIEQQQHMQKQQVNVTHPEKVLKWKLVMEQCPIPPSEVRVACREAESTVGKVLSEHDALYKKEYSAQLGWCIIVTIKRVCLIAALLNLLMGLIFGTLFWTGLVLMVVSLAASFGFALWEEMKLPLWSSAQLQELEKQLQQAREHRNNMRSYLKAVEFLGIEGQTTLYKSEK